MTSQEKKAYLYGYKRARERISRLQIQYNQLFYSELMPGIQSDGMPHAHDPKGLEEYAARRDEILRNIAKAKQECIETLDEIAWNIEQTQSDSPKNTENEKTVLMLRYIEDLEWHEVAERMAYSRSHVDRLHGYALLHFHPVVMSRKNFKSGAE